MVPAPGWQSSRRVPGGLPLQKSPSIQVDEGSVSLFLTFRACKQIQLHRPCLYPFSDANAGPLLRSNPSCSNSNLAKASLNANSQFKSPTALLSVAPGHEPPRRREFTIGTNGKVKIRIGRGPVLSLPKSRQDLLSNRGTGEGEAQSQQSVTANSPWAHATVRCLI